MPVVVNEFEANVERGSEGSDERSGGKPAEMKPRELRRLLRQVEMRAARIRAA
jgi:hypothetical protein